MRAPGERRPACRGGGVQGKARCPVSLSWVSVLRPGPAGTPGRGHALPAWGPPTGPPPSPCALAVRPAHGLVGLAWRADPSCVCGTRTVSARGGEQAGPQSDLQSPGPPGQLRGTAGTAGGWQGTPARGEGSRRDRGWPPVRRQSLAGARLRGPAPQNGLPGPWFRAWALPPAERGPRGHGRGALSAPSTERFCLIGFGFVSRGVRTVGVAEVGASRGRWLWGGAGVSWLRFAFECQPSGQPLEEGGGHSTWSRRGPAGKARGVTRPLRGGQSSERATGPPRCEDRCPGVVGGSQCLPCWPWSPRPVLGRAGQWGARVGRACFC